MVKSKNIILKFILSFSFFLALLLIPFVINKSFSPSNSTQVNALSDTHVMYGKSNALPSQKQNYFKVFKQSAGTKKITSSFSFKDIVGAKIAGLPKNNENDLVIKEINFFTDKASTRIAQYDISYIRNHYIENKQNNFYDVQDLNGGSVYLWNGEKDLPDSTMVTSNINDQNFTTGLKIPNIKNSMNIEFNFNFLNPVDIYDIQLSLDLDSSISEKWFKIGSIELIDKDGNVYRKDNTRLSDLSSNYMKSQETRVILTGKNKANYSQNNIDQHSNTRPNISNDFLKSSKEFVTDSHISNKEGITIIKDLDLANTPNSFYLEFMYWNKILKDAKTNYLNEDIDTFFKDEKNLNLLKETSKLLTINKPDPKDLVKKYLVSNILLKTNKQHKIFFQWKQKNNGGKNLYDLMLYNDGPNQGRAYGSNDVLDDEAILFIKNLNNWYKKFDANNISIKANNIINWDYYSKDLTNKADVSPFLISRKYDSQSKNILFFSGESRFNKSIVPIFRSNYLYFDQYLKSDKTFVNQDFIKINSNNDDLYALFLVYSDDLFRKSLLSSIKKEKIKNLDFSIVNVFLDNYNKKIKNDSQGHGTYFYPLSLSFDGSGNTIDTTTFDLLAYLSKLNNVSKISFKHDNAITSSLPYFINIKDLFWLKDFSHLSDIIFQANEDSIGKSNDPNFHLDGPLNFLQEVAKSNHGLRLLNLSAFWESSSNDENLISQIRDNLSRISPNVVIKVPKYYWDEFITNQSLKKEFLDIWNIRRIGVKTIDISRKNIPLLDSPQIIYNQKTKKFIINNIFVNGEEIMPKIYKGEILWDWESSSIVDETKIAWKNIDTGEFFTYSYVLSKNIDKSKLSKIQVKKQKNIGDVPFNPQNLNNLLSADLDQTINVEGVEYGIKLLNGKAFFNYPVENIKYLLLDSDGNATFYTSIDSMVSNVGKNLSALDVYSFDFIPGPYNEFISIKDNNFVMPSKNGIKKIWINDIEVKEVIIQEGDYYWKMPKNNPKDPNSPIINPTNIKYITENHHYYTEIFDKDGNLIPNLTSLKSFFTGKMPQNHLVEIKDKFPLKNLTDIENEININGNFHKVILYKNILYYDYDLTKVKYVLWDKNDSSKNLYFTELSKLPQFYSSKMLYSIKVPTKDSRPTLPILKSPPSNSFGKTLIEIDGNKYFSILKNGKWYWDISNELAHKIKYKTSEGKYLTIITGQDILKYKLSFIDNTNIDLGQIKELPHFPIKLDKFSAKLLENKYYFDDEPFDFIVKDSWINLRAEHQNQDAFILLDNNVLKFYKKISQVELKNRRHLWSIKLIDNKTKVDPSGNTFIGEKMIEPQNVSNDFITVVLKKGLLKRILIFNSDSGNKIFLDTDKTIEKIKWIDKETGYYYISPETLPLTSKKINSLNMLEFFKKKFIDDPEKAFEDQIRNNKLAGLIIGTFLTIFSLGMVLFVTLKYTLFSKKRGGF